MSIDENFKTRHMSKNKHQKQAKLVKMHKNFVKVARKVEITEAKFC